jgi:hypothetical protein
METDPDRNDGCTMVHHEIQSRHGLKVAEGKRRCGSENPLLPIGLQKSYFRCLTQRTGFSAESIMSWAERPPIANIEPNGNYKSKSKVPLVRREDSGRYAYLPP